jgi:hypothetical protein
VKTFVQGDYEIDVLAHFDVRDPLAPKLDCLYVINARGMPNDERERIAGQLFACVVYRVGDDIDVWNAIPELFDGHDAV